MSNAFPNRVIVLDPAIIDLVIQVAGSAAVIAVPFGWTSARKLKAKPAVRSIDQDAISSLKPDLIVGSSDVAPELNLLARKNFPVWSMPCENVDQVLLGIRQLGGLFGKAQKTDSLVTRLQKALRPVTLAGRRRLRVFFEEWPDPISTCPPWVSDLIHRAGGDDVFQAKSKSSSRHGRIVNLQQILERDPDLIISSWWGRAANSQHYRALPASEHCRAVCSGQLVAFPSKHFLRIGPGLRLGFRLLTQELGKLQGITGPRRTTRSRTILTKAKLSDSAETAFSRNSPVAPLPDTCLTWDEPEMNTDFSNPDYFINRELSWLAFNRRVLEEAQDPTQPLLERVRFLGIVTSNMDEFFEVRVAGIKQLIDHESDDTGPDGLSPRQTFEGIRRMVVDLLDDQYKLWNDDLRPGLAAQGIHLHSFSELRESDQKWATDYFRQEVYPVLTPLAVDAGHPFPQLRNKSHNLFLQLTKADKPKEPLYAVVQIPPILPRLVRIPHPETSQWHYVLIQHLIHTCIHELFPGLNIDQICAFRITRNSDLYINDDDAENLLQTIEVELRKRARGNAVRVEVEEGCSLDLLKHLTDILKLNADDVYFNNGPLNLLHLMPLTSIDALASLRDKPYVPVVTPALSPDSDYFEVLRTKDVLIHHPYESFNTVVEFLQRAAVDPAVLAIKMTLYRTSGDSPIVQALIDAAEQGKQVTVLVELRARFDEANNINWARRLEDAGVHVVYGLVGLKTHCKVLQVVRRDEDHLRHYLHLGTGNYHPSTARFYTDLSLLTANQELGHEIAGLFNAITGLADFTAGKHLLIAPFDLQPGLMRLIQRETENARHGKVGRVIIKVNSMVDMSLIQALYEASQAGVKIDLIVRGICCLRPGLPGVSDNIRVISIVGRFLEHSRIYFFGNDGDPKVYLGSADLMPRNLYRRVEVVFPVLDPKHRERVVSEILPTFLNDCVKARELRADGTYFRVPCKVGQPPSQAQLTFRNLARQAASALNMTTQLPTRESLRPMARPHG